MAGRFRRLVAPLIVALVVLTIALFIVTWLPLRRARDDWRAGRYVDAISTAESWERLHIWTHQYDQLLGAAYLTGANRIAAESHLDNIRDTTLWLSAVPTGEVANKLFARGRYEDFLTYDAAVHPLRKEADAVLYRAAALLATRKVSEAQEAFKSIDRDDVDAKKLAALERAIAQRAEGSYPVALDRDGHTIAAYQIANDDVVSIDASFASIIEKESGALTFENYARVHGTADVLQTTLDPVVQKAALEALGGFRGSLVAIDPKTNEILAIASNPATGPLRNLALESQYEPGSVMKILTGMNAFASGVNVDALFPYNCTGALAIDGRQFGDWLPSGHGVLPDINEALAESCNVVFADLGIRLGRDRLEQFMRRAGFESQATLGPFQVPLGKRVGPVFNNFETGFLAIGLEHESINALHVAMLASMVANHGVLTQPRLVRARLSVLGESLDKSLPPAAQPLAPPAAADRMAAAMRTVVTSPKGTGRRAQIDGLTLALKTGTAGKRENGYHAVILAFAPAENPKIAFGMIAEDSGPAEYAGAKIARDFLMAIRSRL